MKLRTKLTLFTSAFIILLIALVCSFIVFAINNNAKKELKAYRIEAIAQKQEDLKSKVNIVYNLIEKEMAQSKQSAYIERFYGQRVKSAIQMATTIVDGYNQKYKSGQMSLADAKKAALSEIKLLRYDNGTGYIWINDTAYPYPNMIMHPTVPSLDGQVLSSSKWNTALGKKKNLFVAGVEKASTAAGEGFVDYMWPKPTKTGLSSMQPKLSYVALYKPWNWVLGTGVYVDDVERDTAERLKEAVKSMTYGKNNSGYFWIHNTESPIPRIIAHPLLTQLEGKLADSAKFNLKSGKNIYIDVNDILKKGNGSAIYNHKWPKKTAQGIIPDVDKSSYLMYYEPLDWVVGSGIYLDDVDAEVARKQTQIEKQTQKLIFTLVGISLVVLVLSIIATLFYARGISSPIVKLTDVADDISKGKNLNQDIEGTDRKDEIGQLAQAIGRLQTSVNITMKRLMKK